MYHCNCSQTHYIQFKFTIFFSFFRWICASRTLDFQVNFVLFELYEHNINFIKHFLEKAAKNLGIWISSLHCGNTGVCVVLNAPGDAVRVGGIYTNTDQNCEILVFSNNTNVRYHFMWNFMQNVVKQTILKYLHVIKPYGQITRIENCNCLKKKVDFKAFF